MKANTNGRKLKMADTGLDYELYARKVNVSDLAFEVDTYYFTRYYAVFTAYGDKPLFYLAKGDKAPNEVVVYYPNGAFHTSYEPTMPKAANMAVKDAIFYMNK